MGFLRRLLGRKDDDQPAAPARVRGPRVAPPGMTPGQMLDALQAEREEMEIVLRQRYQVCPKCSSDYLRVGTWASKGRAGWTVSCVNCGLMLEKTVEFTTE